MHLSVRIKRASFPCSLDRCLSADLIYTDNFQIITQQSLCACVRYERRLKKIIKPTIHAEASLCMFNVAICLDNYDLVKHSKYLVRDVRLKVACVRCTSMLHVFALFCVAASEAEFN